MRLRTVSLTDRVVDLALILIAIGGVILATERASIGQAQAPGCPTVNSGYYAGTNVPCSSAQCASFNNYPNNMDAPCGALAPTCDDGTFPNTYSATATAGWYGCTASLDMTYPACPSKCAPCANVYIYKDACDQNLKPIGQRCTMDPISIQSSLASGGVPQKQ